MPQSYDMCRDVTIPVGPCGGSATFPCYIRSYKSGASSPKPHTQELPYHRIIKDKYPGVMLYNGEPSAYQNCFGNLGWQLDYDPNVDLRLANNLAAAVRGHQFNPGVTLGEMNESLGMIGSRSKALAKLVEKKFPKVIVAHSLWLEAVYGWLPLLSDLDEAAKFAVAALEVPRRATIRAAAITDGFPQSSAEILWRAKGKVFRKKYAVVHLVEDDTNLAYTGLVDPLSVLWELTPYSFVADWFIPLGSYLNARNFLGSLKATGVNGFITKVNIQSLWVYTADPRYKVAAEMRERYTEHRRYVGVPSVPVPRFKPMSKVLSNWRHAVDGLALAAGVLSRRSLKK